MTERDDTAAARPARKTRAFSFGEPEAVLDRRDLLGHIECWSNGRWYTPPVPPAALARAYRVGPHHESAINIKVNLLTRLFRPSRLMDRMAFQGLALDYLVFGNCFVEQRRNLVGRPLRLERPLAKYVRRGLKPEQFFSIADPRREHEFEAGTVLQLRRADVDQEIYGLPEYLGALQSAFLNEAATIFRRRYYKNGSHAGFILYLTGADWEEPDLDALEAAVESAKGVGNFQNLFLHSPSGDKDGVKVIPISEVAARDEFLGIKNTTRDDVLAAHRVPPQLLGMVPANAGGFGDVQKATEVFVENEIVPLQGVFEQVNAWVGAEAVGFEPYLKPVGA